MAQTIKSKMLQFDETKIKHGYKSQNYIEDNRYDQSDTIPAGMHHCRRTILWEYFSKSGSGRLFRTKEEKRMQKINWHIQRKSVPLLPPGEKKTNMVFQHNKPKAYHEGTCWKNLKAFQRFPFTIHIFTGESCRCHSDQVKYTGDK